MERLCLSGEGPLLGLRQEFPPTKSGRYATAGCHVPRCEQGYEAIRDSWERGGRGPQINIYPATFRCPISSFLPYLTLLSSPDIV